MSTMIVDFMSGRPPVDGRIDHEIASVDFRAKLRRCRLGLALYIVSLAMLFVGFSSAYVVRRGVPGYDSQTGSYSSSWEPLKLPVRLLFLNTVLLCLASLSIEIARRRLPVSSALRDQSKRSEPRWIVLSLFFALAFVAGQLAAWHKLILDRHLLNSGPRVAFFYVFTGTHAFHILSAIVLLTALASAYSRCNRTTRVMAVDLTAWYLHAMTLVWAYLFVFLLFA